MLNSPEFRKPRENVIKPGTPLQVVCTIGSRQPPDLVILGHIGAMKIVGVAIYLGSIATNPRDTPIVKPILETAGIEEYPILLKRATGSRSCP